MGDFLGFTFGGYHSSDLGITRVSGGDRYNEQLYPEMKDRTAEVPGLDGEYYFGSNFGSRQFDIEIAYDSLTEEQFRNLRRVFGTRDIKELIFDERPYKKYLAKLESPIELSYVCFDEPNYTWEKIPLNVDMQTGQTEYIKGISGDYEYKAYDNTTRRVYKGEGKMSLVCYFPFAKSVYKQLPIAEEESDWAISSGILNSIQYAMVDKFINGEIKVYNPGDIETGFRMYLPAAVVNTGVSLFYKNTINETIASLHLKPIILKNEDTGVLIDTNSNLIIGVIDVPLSPDIVTGQTIYTTSGNLYNYAIESGHFFKIEKIPYSNLATIQIEGGAEGIQIFYDYLYF